jgi:hypothetical protein
VELDWDEEDEFVVTLKGVTMGYGNREGMHE